MKLAAGKIAFLLSFGVLLTFYAFAADQKAEDIVAKHLDSIGTQQARVAATTRVVQGTSSFRVLSGQTGGHTEGTAVLVSQGNKYQILIKLPTSDYRGEQFITDGDRVQVSALTASHLRSSLGAFLYVQNAGIKEGLIGGALTTAWALQSMGDHKAKLEFKGTKKIDGQELYDVRYKPRKSTDLEIHLYFDPATYHHVMTVYSLSVQPGLGYVDPQAPGVGADLPAAPAHSPSDAGVLSPTNETSTARQQETRLRLEERFSDFKTQDGITLPMHYQIQFSQELQNGRTNLSEWDVDAQQIANGVGVDPRNFQVK